MNFCGEIKRNRFLDFTINPGPAYKNKKALVELKNHHFLFGCNAFDLIDDTDNDILNKLQEKFLGIFNAGTLPFYWGSYEPDEGKTIEEKMLKAARRLKDKGVVLKGHPLCWHTLCADWLLAYDNKTIMQKQMARITREVKAFKNYIDYWDAINEPIIMPAYNRYDNAMTRIANEYGNEELALACFMQAKAVKPDCFLLINDYDLSRRYERLIENLLEKGCPIDAIGIQTHQHQGYKGIEYMSDVLDRLSKFELPLHFTENTILSGDLVPADCKDLNDAARDDWPSTPEGEQRQMEQTVEFYSLVYSHPAVEAVTWWDLVDGKWLNAPSGLLRRDLSEKPAYKELRKLVSEEWGFPRTELRLSESGELSFRGPEGEYLISIDGKETSLNLDRYKTTATL